VLVLGEDEGGAGYLGGAIGVGGDVLEGGPALGEQGEPALSPASEVAEQRVPGAGVNIRSSFPAGFFTGVWTPIPAPSQPLPARAGIPRAAAR